MLPAAFSAFLLSGSAALLYQVVWQRILVFFSGADVYASTIVVAAFMAGLGVGHLAGGHLADRVSRRASLVLFALAELAIAGFSVLSRGLYYDLLYQRLGPLAIPAAVMAILLFASLLWPTFFMGMSLPLLARALTGKIERAASIVGALYGFNTLGAAAGAFVTTWWVLPHVGLERGLRLGAILNLTCALAVLPFVGRLGVSRENSGRSDEEAVAGGAPPPGRADTASARLPFAAWAAIYAVSGLLALSLEIVWFRLLGVMVKSTAFTFGTLLTLYLGGLGAGSLAGGAYARRFRRPAVTFLALQTAVGLSATLLIAMVVGIFDDVRWFRAYFSAYEPLDVREAIEWLRGLFVGGAAPGAGRLPWQFAVLYFALPALLIVPPTFLMGFSFPVLQQVVQTDLARLGRRVGLLLVANIVGSVVGTVLTGWVLLDTLGTAGTLKVLAGLSVFFILLGVALLQTVGGAPSRDVVTVRPARIRLGFGEAGRRSLGTAWGTRAVAAVAVATVLVLVVALPDAATLWARLHGAGIDRVIVGEDASGLSVLRLEPGTQQVRATVFVNGVGQSVMPYGDIHTALGMLPAFVHPDPKQVAIIGLGSGDTVYGVAGRPQIEKIACVEIIRLQIDTLRQLGRRSPYGGLLGMLGDPRIEHIAGDGRSYLMRSAQTFDIIEADALRPTSAYSGNLYSDAYFTLVRDRLRPRGLAATWSPTPRIHNAFLKAFPHVLSLPGILLGSNDPIDLDREAITARLGDRRVRDHYGRAGVDAEQLMAFYLADPARYTPDFSRDVLTDFNTDLFPKDEYDLSARAR